LDNITTFNFNDLEKFDKIFVLVSGGIDSTYLYEMINSLFPNKTYAVNCWNPYEQSKTLSIFQKLSNYIEVRPQSKLNYKKVLIESFNNIPKAIELRKAGKYHKKVFPCCRFIKHNAFKKDPLFQEKNTVVISGIKAGDGQQRGFWLNDLRKGTKTVKKGFYHLHKEGQYYCYPFRDYRERELPNYILKLLRKKYPGLDHSGCSLCPVLVVFHDKIKDESRTIGSIKFYHKIINQKTLEVFM